MASSSIFISASDARQNPIRETVIHDEARAIESAILAAVKDGLYQATLSDGSPMTSGGAVNIAVASVDLNTDQLYVPNHPFKTGDMATVSSNGTLPSPLDGTGFYSVIYIDADHIKLAASASAALNARPISIDFTVGVTNIDLVDQGHGYLTAPRVTVDPSPAGITAAAVANLATWGSIDSIAVLSPGRGYTDVPSVAISAQGADAAAGTVSFLVVSASVAAGGSDYRLGDVISVVGGIGTSATVTVTGIATNGAVTAIALGNPGSYTDLPNLSSVSTAVQPAGGSNCTLNLTMGIGAIAVGTGGMGYSAAPVISVSGGNGVGAFVSAVVSAGRITAFEVIRSGSGYTATPSITIDSGSSAAAIAVLRPTVVDSIEITYDGNGAYSTMPNISITPIGSGATAGTVTMLVTNATITNSGSGYTLGDVLLTSGGDGTSNASIQVTSVGTIGEILSYNLITSGSYTFLPILKSNNIRGGSGRSATFDLTVGIESIQVDSPGVDYTTPPTVIITPTDGNGRGAAAVTRLTTWWVNQIVVTNSGSGYTSIPLVTITSGDGAQATAVITNGSISAVEIIDRGANYTCPPRVSIDGAGILTAMLAPTGIDRIDVTSGGSNWISAPIVYVMPGAAQQGAVVSPAIVSNIGYSLANIVVTDAGSGYDTAPAVAISAPGGAGAMPAEAIARLGAGTGTLVIRLYPQSRDYWKVWKNQDPSNALYTRPYAERMDTVIAYFTDLGYTINRQTNPATTSTIQWTVMW
jgi:hypothetical protein